MIYKVSTKGFQPIPGYEGRYEIDFFANIRRVWKKSGKKSIMAAHKKNGELLIQLTGFDGTRKCYKVAHLMALTFINGYTKGVSVYHIDGIKTNNILSNLKLADKKTLGKITGASAKRQTVAKCKPNGEVVSFYSSARAAAKENYFSYQTIIDRCNGKTKSRIAPDGYVYLWADNLVDGSDKNRRKRNQTKFSIDDLLKEG